MLDKLFDRFVADPIADAVDVIEGLTEGELRAMAAARFGADVVVGLGASELIELLDSNH
jgi:hypothetical protein